MSVQRSVRGAAAGGAAAAVWAAQQPLDKRIFGTEYDDVELLGKLITRDSGWHAAGLALHMANGAVFGAVYALLRPLAPLPPVVVRPAAGLAEHLGFWPLGRLIDSNHPARSELAPLTGNPRAFAQSAWRHLLFGLVLGELERRLNADDEYEPPEVPVSSNGHGNIERAAAGATEA